ncbi:MAG: hypothetical protein EOP52_10705 [Sphingobacteriales bacterium]|nr:MAG: hypothetical protein EOP52_10705 [Sphingobacteriales bacterium]
MKFIFAPLAALPLFSMVVACNPPEADHAPGTAAVANPPVAVSQEATLPGTMCFLNVEGRDTSHIQLTITGSQISGNYDWLPYEKDARRGTLKGTMEGSGAEQKVRGTWSYMQEGMNQELPFEAMLTRETLRQRDYESDAATGQEKLSAAATYPVVFNAVACAGN